MFLYLLALIGIHKNISVFINIIEDVIIAVCKPSFHIMDSDEHVKGQCAGWRPPVQSRSKPDHMRSAMAKAG